MKELTQEQIERYNKEIAHFCKSVHNMSFDTDWQLLMEAYCELCKVLPFNFIDIQRDHVYANGYIDLPFQQAIFFVVGENCEKYNKREFLIKNQS
jgi:hypothetical protein